MRFRKKPIVVEAWRFNGTRESIEHLLNSSGECWVTFLEAGHDRDGFIPPQLRIQTLEGEMLANAGDWIIKGVKGEIYPCKPDIFKATYEPAE